MRIATCVWMVVAAGCSLPLDVLRGTRDAGQDAAIVDASFDDSAIGNPSPVAQSCGGIGEACCGSSDDCDVGGCLRGICAAYGGAYSERLGCGAEISCEVSNVYTGACGCPPDFQAMAAVRPGGTCTDSAPSELSLLACVASRTRGSAWGGWWLRADAAGPCGDAEVCLAPNPYNQRCGCYEQDHVLEVSVTLPALRCGGQAATVGVCVQRAGRLARFGGVFARPAGSTDGCTSPNPLTGACACPAGGEEQSFEVAGAVLVVCNL